MSFCLCISIRINRDVGKRGGGVEIEQMRETLMVVDLTVPTMPDCLGSSLIQPLTSSNICISECSRSLACWQQERRERRNLIAFRYSNSVVIELSHSRHRQRNDSSRSDNSIHSIYERTKTRARVWLLLQQHHHCPDTADPFHSIEAGKNTASRVCDTDIEESQAINSCIDWRLLAL